MKFLLTIVLALTSMASFSATNLGYICVPSNQVEAKKLEKLGPKIGEDYLSAIGVLVVRPETCQEIHAMIYRDICKAGPYFVAIGLDSSSVLTVKGNTKINLECEEDQVVGPLPVLGGSN